MQTRITTKTTTRNLTSLVILSTLAIIAATFAPNLAFAAQPIPAPTGLTATSINPTQIQLSWTAPVGFGANTIRGYIIDRESPVGGGFVEIVANTTNTNTAYLDVGLLDDTTYNYRVYTDYNGTTGSKSAASNTAFARTFGFGSGDCTGDCVPPTLGLDSKGTRWVNEGFSYNGNPVDVELFFTPYPLITTKVGVVNTAVFKIFEDGGPDEIRHLDLAFGLANGQILADSRASIEWDRTWDRVETVKVVDPEHSLKDVKVEATEGPCKSEDVLKNDCLIVVIYHTFAAPLEFNIVGTNVWDEKRNAWQNYYNHGVEIIGESMNGPKQYLGIHHGNVLVLTETGKNNAVDEEGNTWTFDKEWLMDYIPKGKIVDQVSKYHGIDRDHAYFDIYKKGQIIVAEYTLAEIMEKTRSIDSPYEKEFVHKTLDLDLVTQKIAGIELQRALIAMNQKN